MLCAIKCFLNESCEGKFSGDEGATARASGAPTGAGGGGLTSGDSSHAPSYSGRFLFSPGHSPTTSIGEDLMDVRALTFNDDDDNGLR